LRGLVQVALRIRPDIPAPKEIVRPADRIRDAAKHLFAANGYDSTTTSAVTRSAGTSESQLMKHFGGKQGLLAAIFDEGWDRICEQIVKALENLHDPIEKLHAILLTVISMLESDAEFKILILFDGRRMRKGQTIALADGFLRFVALLDSVLTEMRTE